MDETRSEPNVDEPLEELTVKVAPLETPEEPEVDLTSLETPEEPKADLTPVDPVQEIQILREINRRWRQAAIGSIFVTVLVGIVSAVQFAGTFVTCKWLDEAKHERQWWLKEAKVEREVTRKDVTKQLASNEETLARELEKLASWKKDYEWSRRKELERLLADLREAEQRTLALNQASRSILDKVCKTYELQEKKIASLEKMQAIENELVEIEKSLMKLGEKLLMDGVLKLSPKEEEEFRSRLNPRMYADPKQRCPYDPNPGRKPPMPE